MGLTVHGSIHVRIDNKNDPNVGTTQYVITPLFKGESFDVYEEVKTKSLHVINCAAVLRPHPFRVFASEADAARQVARDTRIWYFKMMMLASAFFFLINVMFGAITCLVACLVWYMVPKNEYPVVFVRQFYSDNFTFYTRSVHHLGTGTVLIRNAPMAMMSNYGSGKIFYSGEYQCNLVCDVDGPGEIHLNHNVDSFHATVANYGRIFGPIIHSRGNLTASSNGCIKSKARYYSYIRTNDNGGKTHVYRFK